MSDRGSKCERCGRLQTRLDVRQIGVYIDSGNRTGNFFVTKNKKIITLKNGSLLFKSNSCDNLNILRHYLGCYQIVFLELNNFDDFL